MKQKRFLSDDEHVRLVEIGDSFWTAFGRLAADHIAQMPADLEDLTMAHLQDLCSIYGSRAHEHIAEYRKVHKT